MDSRQLPRATHLTCGVLEGRTHTALAETHRRGSWGTAASIGSPCTPWLLRARGQRGGTQPRGAGSAPTSPAEQLLLAVPRAKSEPQPSASACRLSLLSSVLYSHPGNTGRPRALLPAPAAARLAIPVAPSTVPAPRIAVPELPEFPAHPHGGRCTDTASGGEPHVSIPPEPPANAGEGSHLQESGELSQKYF